MRTKKNKTIIESPELFVENIVSKDFPDVISTEFMRYAYSVMEDRALPDARDGLKPSQRRILITMDDLHLNSGASTVKCAKIAGNCSANYHPHGEAIVYPTLVRLAQDWIMRYRLIHPQGNFGGLDPDASAAQMRYTEAKLSKFGDTMVQDLSPNVVKYIPNYDEKLQEPTVLPSVLPNLLVNGASGIAVGVATKLPPHNLNEVVEVIKAYIENPNITTQEILKLMPGPDFPTGGVLLGQDGVKSYYETGRGSLQIEGCYTIEAGAKDTQQIIITELPYGASPAQLSEEIESLVKDKKIDGIIDMKDLSCRKDKELQIKVVVWVGKNGNTNLILNQLLKNTCLKQTFSVNQTVLINGAVVENASIKTLVKAFVDHRQEILTNKFNAELVKSKDRVHILDGLLNVTKYIDEVIKLIRGSDSPEDAQIKLIEKKYVETEVQAKAVLQITLRQLTKLEAQTLRNEQDTLNARILWLIDVLGNSKKIQKLIIKEQDELAKKLGDARRTKIGHSSEDISHEDLIQEEQIVISFSKDGYIKRIPLDTYRVQARGGKGISSATTRADDEMSDIYIASTHETLLFFTNKGLLYKKKGYELPIGTRVSKGTHVANILSLNAEEFVTNMIPVKSMDQDLNLVLITKNGIIKRSKLNIYDTALKTRGLPAIKLRPKDSLAFAELTNGKQDIFIVTKKGKAIRYPESTVRFIASRMSAGVRALNLAADDEIVQMLIFDVEANPDVLVITELGFGKRTEITKYRCLQGRFAKGVDTIDKVKIDRNGYIVGACTVMPNDSILLLTSQAKIIQMPVESIRSVNRTAAGVKVVNLNAGDTVKAVTKIANGAVDLE